MVNRPAELPPVPLTDRKPRPWQRPWFLPLLITLLAASLRFMFLDRPGIWGDEASTFGRVNGTDAQLIERLKFDGFMPLHYQLYFLLAHLVKLTPLWMRLWPALAGTATIPATFFLARQLVSRRVALVAMLLAATSAFQLYYSRDAKMYAGQWLFVVLSMGCFFWWLAPEPVQKASRRLRYWLWIFCSLAAIGIHAPSLLVIGLQPLFFLAHPGKRWSRALAMLLGIAFLAAVPAIYYSTYNKWIENAQDNWNTSMLQWVKLYNDGRELPQLLRFTGTAYAFGWEWPDKPFVRSEVQPWVLRSFELASITLAAVLLLGILPWKTLFSRARTFTRNLIRKREPAHPRPSLPAEFSPLSLPRLTFILGAWITLPATILYTLSMDAPTAPWWPILEILHTHGHALLTPPALLTAAIALLILIALAFSLRRKFEWATFFLSVFLLVGLSSAIFAGIMFKRYHPGALHGWALAWPPWRNVKFDAWTKPEYGKMLWMPRYLGGVYPALLLITAALLTRLPAGIRHLAIFALVAVNLANHAALLYLSPEPPIASVVADLWADSEAQKAGITGGPPIVFHGGGRWGSGYEPGTSNLTGVVGRYHVALLAGVPLDPEQFRAGWSFVEKFLVSRANLRPAAIRAELAKRPGVTSLLYWSRADPAPTTRGTPATPFTLALGRQWELASSEFFQSYDHWTWWKRGTLSRTLYHLRENLPPEPPQPPPRRPTTPRPATRPTTRPNTHPTTHPTTRPPR